jgi:hypothetical protein
MSKIPKLKTKMVQILINDEANNDDWVVVFPDGNKRGMVYKNKKFQGEYDPVGGLANKTRALHMVRYYINNPPKGDIH